MPKYFKEPFALNGDKGAIPDAAQPNGSISYSQGWGVNYALPQGSPARLTVDRRGTNQLDFDITDAMREIQETGLLTYDAQVNYKVFARVTGSDGATYKALLVSGPDQGGAVDPVGDLSGTWESTMASIPALFGYKSGLEIGPGSINPLDDITVRPGLATDSTNVSSISLPATLFTKQIALPWVVGDNQGGLASALTLTIDTWYHVFALVSPDGSINDVGFDTDINAINLTTDDAIGYLYRRIGSFLTDATPQVVPFYQLGNNISFSSVVVDYSGNSFTGSIAVTVPPDVNVSVRGSCFWEGNNNINHGILVGDFTQTAGANVFNFGSWRDTSADFHSTGNFEVLTNVLSQYSLVETLGPTGPGFNLYTRGWTEIF